MLLGTQPLSVQTCRHDRKCHIRDWLSARWATPTSTHSCANLRLNLTFLGAVVTWLRITHRRVSACISICSSRQQLKLDNRVCLFSWPVQKQPSTSCKNNISIWFNVPPAQPDSRAKTEAWRRDLTSETTPEPSLILTAISDGSWPKLTPTQTRRVQQKLKAKRFNLPSFVWVKEWQI